MGRNLFLFSQFVGGFCQQELEQEKHDENKNNQMGNFLPIAGREAESENQNHTTFVKDHIGLVSEESNGKDLGNEKKASGVGEISAKTGYLRLLTFLRVPHKRASSFPKLPISFNHIAAPPKSVLTPYKAIFAESEKEQWLYREAVLEKSLRQLQIATDGHKQKEAILEETVDQLHNENNEHLQKEAALELKVVELQSEIDSLRQKEVSLLETLKHLESEKCVWILKEETEEVCHLTDDLFFNILSHLPTEILIGLKVVSKGWYHLISNRSFIKTQVVNTKQIVSGFFYQETFQWSNSDLSSVAYLPVKENYKVRHDLLDFLPEHVVVLASCHGVICCRNFLLQDQIYICNPLTKEFITVRCAGLDKDSSVALAFDPSQEPQGTSTNFTLVRVQPFRTIEMGRHFTFETYSSIEGAWKKTMEICKCRDTLFRNKGIYVGGLLYWLTDEDRILAFDVNSSHSFLISVPIPAPEFGGFPVACIGESEGKLHYVKAYERKVYVWCLEDSFECKWTLEKEPRNLFCDLHKSGRNLCIKMSPLAFKDGLLLMRICQEIYLYNFKTGNLQIVTECSVLGSGILSVPTVFDYSMSFIPISS